MQPRTTRPAAGTWRPRAALAGPRTGRHIGLLVALTLAVSSATVGYTGTAAAVAAPHKAATHAKKPAHSKKPPANPSDKQIKNAAAAKSKAASDVGRLSGLIVGINGQINTLNGLSELAGEKYLKAKWDLGLAVTAATKATAAVGAAKKRYNAARAQSRLFIIATYMNHNSDSSGLLTAADPNTLLDRDDLGRYTSVRQLDAVGNLTRATVARSNAEAAATIAVARRTTLTAAARKAQLAADLAVSNAKTQRAALVIKKTSYEHQLTAAGEALTGLKNKRAAYNAWVLMEKKIKAAEARRAAAARKRMLAAQARARKRLLAAQAREREKQARERHSSNSNSGASNSSTNTGGNNGGGGGSGGGGGGTGNGQWTPAKGEAAVHRAMQWLGENYSFDAGNYNGPSFGTCNVGVEWNACHVWGFDCSGLAMYAWSPAGIYMPHYAASQYFYGRVHPSVDNLMPGDLVFWSSNGTEAGIHHVAIYIGNGNVVEAPHTGDVVKVTSLWFDGYYGATRPGS